VLLCASTALAMLAGCSTAVPLARSVVPEPDAEPARSIEVRPVTARRIAIAPAPSVVFANLSPVTEAGVEFAAGGEANEMPVVPTTAPPPSSTAPASTLAPTPTTSARPRSMVLEPAAAALPLDVAAAADFTSRTNALRVAAGLVPLARNTQLDALAAGWARELVSTGVLRHSTIPDAIVANGWRIGGENVGFGASVASVHQALVASPGHYANLAGPRYTNFGIAVVSGPDGRLWVCELFAG
jgi:uncharacterized protein YkwD